MIREDTLGSNSSLIEVLAEEHKKIRVTYNKLMSAAVDKQYALVDQELNEFNAEIRAHYGHAEKKLYSHIKSYIHINYPKREKAFTKLMLEMKNISVEIFYILNQSPNIPVTGQTYSEFMVEFLRIGKIMNERIIREQNILFKMYAQTNIQSNGVRQVG